MSLLDRLIAIKQQAAEQADKTIVDKESVSIPTPLWVFTEICNKARYEVSTDYMHGARALEAWLTTPSTPLQLSSEPSPVRIPAILDNYELQQLAMIASRYKQQALLDHGLVNAMPKLLAYEHEMVQHLLMTASINK